MLFQSVDHYSSTTNSYLYEMIDESQSPRSASGNFNKIIEYRKNNVIHKSTEKARLASF